MKPHKNGREEMTKQKPSHGRQLSEPNDSVRKSQAALKSTLNAALITESYSATFGSLDPLCLAKELSAKCNDTYNGDLRAVETMLTSQAFALQSIFTTMALRAANTDYIDMIDKCLRLALKAQSQCARTLEVLGNIKNPSSFALVRQANIGHAVQVNNGTHECYAAPEQTNHARENQNLSNELLEIKDEQRLDPRTPNPTSRTDTAMETMDKVNGASNERRET